MAWAHHVEGTDASDAMPADAPRKRVDHALMLVIALLLIGAVVVAIGLWQRV